MEHTDRAVQVLTAITAPPKYQGSGDSLILHYFEHIHEQHRQWLQLILLLSWNSLSHFIFYGRS
jgi:hypothetical protein